MRSSTPEENHFIYQNIAEELTQASQSATGRRVELKVEFVENYLDPSYVAERMRSVGSQTDMLVVVATDSSYTSEMIGVLAGRGIPVVALLSDLSAPDLAGYVGINDRIAGRTAAWSIARCASQPGSVGILIGSHGYLGQEDREIGFRTYFRGKAPNFKVLDRGRFVPLRKANFQESRPMSVTHSRRPHGRVLSEERSTSLLLLIYPSLRARRSKYV